MSAVFRIERPADAAPVIRCMACKRMERYWDDRTASKWKAAHAEACPQGRPRL